MPRDRNLTVSFTLLPCQNDEMARFSIQTRIPTLRPKIELLRYFQLQDRRCLSDDLWRMQDWRWEGFDQAVLWGRPFPVYRTILALIKQPLKGHIITTESVSFVEILCWYWKVQFGLVLFYPYHSLFYLFRTCRHVLIACKRRLLWADYICLTNTDPDDTYL